VSAPEPYPPGPPGTPPSPSDRYFEGLTYSRAKNAFWLGFFSMICFGLFTGIPAIFVGGMALRDIKASRGRLTGRGSAWAGIVFGIIGTFGSTGVIWHQADCDHRTGVGVHALDHC
jgi:sulfite exporter TauE/SafE